MSTSVEAIASRIKPGEPLIVHGYKYIRVKYCKEAINLLGLICQHVCCCWCPTTNWHQRWKSLKDTQVKSTGILITDLSSLSNIDGDRNKEFTFRLIKFLGRNKHRKIILTGNMIPARIQELFPHNILDFDSR